MTSTTELIWNLKRLIRDGFPQGLPLDDMDTMYIKYFQSPTFPSAQSVDADCQHWWQVFKRSPKFKYWFRLDNKNMLHARPVPEPDLKAYFRLVRYTQYLMVRQAAKTDEWSGLSESESDSDGGQDWMIQIYNKMLEETEGSGSNEVSMDLGYSGTQSSVSEPLDANTDSHESEFILPDKEVPDSWKDSNPNAKANVNEVEVEKIAVIDLAESESEEELSINGSDSALDPPSWMIENSDSDRANPDVEETKDANVTLQHEPTPPPLAKKLRAEPQPVKEKARFIPAFISGKDKETETRGCGSSKHVHTDPKVASLKVTSKSYNSLTGGSRTAVACSRNSAADQQRKAENTIRNIDGLRVASFRAPPDVPRLIATGPPSSEPRQRDRERERRSPPRSRPPKRARLLQDHQANNPRPRVVSLLQNLLPNETARHRFSPEDTVRRNLDKLFQPSFCKICDCRLSRLSSRVNHYEASRHRLNLESWLCTRGVPRHWSGRFTWKEVKRRGRVEDWEIRCLNLLRDANRFLEQNRACLAEYTRGGSLQSKLEEIRQNLLDGYCVYLSETTESMNEILIRLRLSRKQHGAPGYAEQQQLEQIFDSGLEAIKQEFRGWASIPNVTIEFI